MMAAEEALLFRGADASLVGVLHRANAPCARGVLIVVGGPQYRVGSHRQFVLLARDLAAAGVPVLRFDYRGMGDSEGPAVGFEGVDADIRAAVDEFVRRVPELREVALWGLCDAASAVAMYGFRDPRVVGLALLNPWVRQQQSEARTQLRHYYLSRLFDGAQLKKLLTGRMNVWQSARDLFRTVRNSMASAPAPEVSAAGTGSFVTRMLDGIGRFRGKTLLILSGDDLTAAEFKDEVARSAAWRKALERPSLTRHDFAEANHTFSTKEWRARVSAWTLEWVSSL
jgi:exosortase A-associated hydrolase 1